VDGSGAPKPESSDPPDPEECSEGAFEPRYELASSLRLLLLD